MKSRAETELDVNIHAWKNSTFKKKLMNHPHEALREMGMNKIPQSLNIKVIEEDSYTWCIVLRKAPSGAKSMSEEALKKTRAAGGMPGILCP